MLTIPNFGRIASIPVNFMHKGKDYKGIFKEVPGAAGHIWQLTVNGRHWGRMMYLQAPGEPGMPIAVKDIKYELRFHTQSGYIDYLEPEFIDLFISWYQ